MNKKYLLLFIGIIVVFIIFVGVIFLQQRPQQTPPNPSSLHNQNPATLQTNQQKTTAPSITLVPLANTPKEAAQQFYTYYFSSQTSPLANGAYENNPYLSQDFKDIIGALYNNGNAPVFCFQNKRANITVGKEQQVYSDNQYLTEEIISDASDGKDLYRVRLENMNGKWLIVDVNCIY